MNYIMKMIANQFPGSVNLLRNLAQCIENELKPALPDGSSLDLGMRRLDLMSNSGVNHLSSTVPLNNKNSSQVDSSSRMSVDISKDKNSPNIREGSMQNNNGISGKLI
jgi:hypothetical protein